MSRILYVSDNFEFFNNYRAFLIEMPYKYYLKDLQAEINKDKSLFPSKNYLDNLRNNIELLNFIEIMDSNVYFWACEDLSKFKLLTTNDINILESSEIKKTSRKLFSLLYLTCISIEMSIENYTKYGMEDEINQKKIIYQRLFDMDADIQQWIADYYFMKYLNEMELINSNEKPIKNIIKENKRIIIEYFVKFNKKTIFLNSDIELFILICISQENEFESISYIFMKDIENEYLDKEIDINTLENIIKKNGKLYSTSDFINLDEKYLKQFNM
jgi:hypothetical protein